MLYSKRVTRALFALICVFVCLISFNSLAAAYADERELYLGGFAAGFVLNTTTVEVVGICDVMTEDGIESPARDCGIKTGDIIEKVNGYEINSVSDLNAALCIPSKNCTIQIERGGQSIDMNINPALDKISGQKKLGLLVKDSVNGIGTVTYIDKTNGTFASLGHPVADQSKKIMQINGGSIYTCAIYDVKKGLRGNPGELKGSIESDYMIGKASKNCECGIFGEISSDFDTSGLKKIKAAKINEVKMGKASIYSTVEANTTKEYEISIVKIDPLNKDNRNFVIKIDDENLINLSGGIVQGMSGSPIVQDGKLIGAVTHVFVNDPTRGYGISIDKMLNSY